MEGNLSQLQFCRYQATLGNVVVTFWATADGEIIGPQGRRVDASLGATTTSEPETLPSELFAGQDVGENLRCGNVWEAVPALITSLGPLLDRLCAPLRRPPRVLELGAGMGLPGLWAAARGAEVVLTDSNLAVLECSKCPRWHPSSAPATPQSARGGPVQLGTSRVAPRPLGSQPSPQVLELAASKVADLTAFDLIRQVSNRSPAIAVTPPSRRLHYRDITVTSPSPPGVEQEPGQERGAEGGAP